MSGINKQTPGPVKSRRANTLVCHIDWPEGAPPSLTGSPLAAVFAPSVTPGENDTDIMAANARLLAAAYTAFDAAGRQMGLGVDAAEMAERTASGEITDLINALRAMLVGCDKDAPEQFPGHTEAYLRTVAIPRAKDILAKLGMLS